MRSPLLTLLAAGLLAAAAGAQTDDFEAYVVGYGGAENIGSLVLDENTVTGTGQGPGLVADGCVYSCAGNSLQWNGPGWFGQPSKDLLANSGDGRLTLTYDSPVSSMSLELFAFSGFPDTTVVTVFNSSGATLSTTTVSVPGSTPVPFAFSGADIKTVTIQSTVYGWSTIIDNHSYGGAPVFTLAKSGTCPGGMTLTTTNGTASSAVAVLHGAAGSFTKPSGTCAGLTLGIASPKLGAIIGSNGSGAASLSFGAMAGWCGRTVQAVDISTCTASNTITL